MKVIYSMVLMAVVAVLVVTCAPLSASETDSRIESTAKDLYVFKTYLKSDEIIIKSTDGVVTLTGTVANKHHKLLAEETIASMPGVKSVDNKLEIKGEQPVENSDAWISEKVKTALMFYRNVSASATEVSVKDGVVTLSGNATSEAQKQLTTEYAKDVEGVKDVKNEMTVSETPNKENQTLSEQIDDASITAQVKLSLLYHKGTSGLKTHVKTQDGVVTLSGMAQNAAEKDLATKFVMDINGVKKVKNLMTIEKPKTK